MYLWGEYSELYEETDVFGYKLNHFVAKLQLEISFIYRKRASIDGGQKTKRIWL